MSKNTKTIKELEKIHEDVHDLYTYAVQDIDQVLYEARLFHLHKKLMKLIEKLKKENE